MDGSGLTFQSQITWSGNSLQTTFLDSHRLQTTITQQTFDSFGVLEKPQPRSSMSKESCTSRFCPNKAKTNIRLDVVANPGPPALTRIALGWTGIGVQVLFEIDLDLLPVRMSPIEWNRRFPAYRSKSLCRRWALGPRRYPGMPSPSDAASQRAAPEESVRLHAREISHPVQRRQPARLTVRQG